LQELIKFFEDRNLTEMAAGLKQDLVSMKRASAPPEKEIQDRTLTLIRKAVKADEAKKLKEEINTASKRGAAQPS